MCDDIHSNHNSSSIGHRPFKLSFEVDCGAPISAYLAVKRLPNVLPALSSAAAVTVVFLRLLILTRLASQAGADVYCVT